MKKLEKRDYLNISLIIISVLIYVLVLYLKGYIFGSKIDWTNQHIVFPDYFRRIFYNTGKLIPSMALNIGMGQNIFYFAYYGLLSPFIIISYLVPFIPMYIYIPIISILSLLISTVMFYKWIKVKYNSKIALITTIIFAFNAPFIYHFHRHIMFVIYMPFLIGALKSIDYYFKEKNPLPLIIYSFLMIMTSFYFSVPGIITIGIYTLYSLFKNHKFNPKPLFKIIYFVLVAVLLSGILLVPTAYALFSGRIHTLNNIPFINFIFNNYNYTFYNSYYSWGVTLIYVLGAIYGFITKKKSEIFLSIILSLIILLPFASYFLNAFMYIDGKCFIPFIPVALLSVAEFSNSLLTKKIDIKKILMIFSPCLLLFVIWALKNPNIYLLIADGIFMIMGLLLLKKQKHLIFIFTILVSLASFILSSCNETYIKLKDIKNINNEAYYELTDIEDEDNLYRTSIETNVIDNPNRIYNINEYQSTIYSSSSNKYYFNFIRYVFQNEVINRDNTTITQTSNVLFDIYSGSKYLITDNTPPIGYTEVKSIDNLTLYQNSDVLPIGYATNKIMSKREFDLLSYPETIDALLNYIIVDKSIDNVYVSNVKEYTGNYKVEDYNNLTYTYKNKNIIIDAKKEANIKIKLSSPIKDKVFIIKFTMNKEKEGYACSSNITINNITNALSCSNWKYHNHNNTFEYVLSSNEPLSELDINLTKGLYDISDIELYTIDYNLIKNINNHIDPLIIDQINSTNDTIYGTINAKDDGYVKVTIPYESKGFRIYVDGERVSKVKVDDTFLGFEITKGEHNIKITYHSPYLRTGIIISIIGLILLTITIIYKYVNKKVNKYLNKALKVLKRTYKKVIKYLKNNKGFILLFISLFILDLAIRLFYNKTVGFYHWYKIVPNLFSIIWILLILSLTKIFKNKIGKIIYLVLYIFSLIMFLVQAIYFSYFNTFFDYGVLKVAGEGFAYISSVIMNIKIWVYIVTIISIILTYKGLKIIKCDKKINIIKLIITILIFILLELTIPLLLGQKKTEVEWDDWRNPRLIYNSYNDNNKSFMVSGLFEYNIRSFYKTFIVSNNKELTKSEKEVLDENFKELTINNTNKYTGLFKGKNLIIIQLESIDTFLVDKNTMPTLYNLTKNGINFSNHYSYTSGGGSTFNSEFMVNVGYSGAYNYNQSAYAFSRNTYTYSLPNLFKNEGYIVNAFHMNSAEYYSRGVNYKAFGYDSYNGLKDLNEYKNNEYWLDTELINNKTFNEKIISTDKPFVSYIITYSAHMPYKTTKGTCSMLTDQTGLTEEECLRIQAKETDDFIKILIDNLKEKDLLDNTVIVLFADHYIYTLEDKSILDKYKETSNNLINHTPFVIYNNDLRLNIKKVNSQLDILPTILNLFGIEYYTNNYIGTDILDSSFYPLVFFPDGSWYNGESYITNGEYQSGKKISTKEIEKNNLIVKRKMLLNDAVIKSDYFAKK